MRLVTPGTLTEDALLEGAQPNLLLALARAGRELGAAWLDISTGLFETAAVTDLPGLLGRLDPAEILAPADLPLADYDNRRAPETLPPPPLAARARVAEAFGAATLDGFGSFTDAEAMAAAAALAYVRTTQAGKLPALSPPAQRPADGTLAMDAATRASLEITRARDGGVSHTLLAAADRTLTAPGARCLANWLSAPLTDPAAIAARQDAWAAAEPGTRRGRRAAPGPARRAGRHPRAGPAIARPRRPARPAGGTPDAGRRQHRSPAAIAITGPVAGQPGHRPGAAATARRRAGRQPAAAAGRRRRHRRGLRRRAGRRTPPARRQPPGDQRAAAGLRPALRRRLAQDPPPRPAGLRDRGRRPRPPRRCGRIRT